MRGIRMIEEEEKVKWLKDSRVEKDSEGNKILIATEITKDYFGIFKEDVLNGMEYEDVSQIQQMLFHIIKHFNIREINLNRRIGKLEKQIIKLKKKVKK